LGDDSGGREDKVGQHYCCRRSCNERCIATQMSHQHEERDSGPRSQNCHRAEYVQVLEDEILQ